jgi:predicted nucleic acid-binding protein
MKQGRVIELDESTALLAAKLSLQHKLPMADSLMLAAARSHQALLWTQDSDFKGLDGVKYFPRRKSK